MKVILKHLLLHPRSKCELLLVGLAWKDHVIRLIAIVVERQQMDAHLKVVMVAVALRGRLVAVLAQEYVTSIGAELCKVCEAASEVIHKLHLLGISLECEAAALWVIACTSKTTEDDAAL